MKKVLCSLFFSSCVFVLNTMDVKPSNTAKLKKQIAQYCAIEPQKKFKIFDPEKMVKEGIEWDTFVPNNLLITPDEKGVLIGEPGRVRYVNFGVLFETEPAVLIEHPCVKHPPMLAVAQTGKLLLVVSAGNYTVSGHRFSEYIIFQNEISDSVDNKSHNIFHQKLSEVKKMSWPIQAIALNSTGKVLAIASRDCVHVIELETGETRESKFQPRGNILVVDIAVKPGDIQVAAVDNNGIVDIKKMFGEGKDIEFSNLKHVETADIIEKIIFFDTSDLLYVAGDKAKIIKKGSWLENSQGTVKSRIFSYDETYNLVLPDQGLQYATVHWTDNTNLSKNARLKMKVRRENGTSVDEFILKMSDLPEVYGFITKMGQDRSGLTHLLPAVALRGGRSAAIATDGYLRAWVLPKRSEVCYEEAQKYIVGEIQRDHLMRRRSLSSPNVGEQPKKNNEAPAVDNKAKRKSSQRGAFRVFRSSLSMDKKKKDEDHGPVQSHSYSPKEKEDEVLSPRHSINEEEFNRASTQDYRNDQERLETRHSGKDSLKKK
ncbi:MAG TPA: hypothetical protein VJJ26_04815 [Candidatus Babeliales bacterium]|nr:hypothetical protein [Candidatus Babeliales bacterium]